MEKPEHSTKITYYLRDISPGMISAWKEVFDSLQDTFKISTGDIFQEAPAADAIVSPANSFGFMNGGIDMAYSHHFGRQLQERLQTLLMTQCDGELHVGQAVIIPTFEPGSNTATTHKWYSDPKYNEGKVIKHLISAPTMRVPMTVNKTINAYLAFRAVIHAVKNHNAKMEDKITSVLCPGLCTAVGQMPHKRCAVQMKVAWESCGGRGVTPDSLYEGLKQQEYMMTV